MSQSEYARRRDCSQKAVADAIKDGRVSRSVVRVNGVAKIADPDLADEEWAANTRTKATPEAKAAADAAYQSMRAQHEREKLRLAELKRQEAELDLAKKRGSLIEFAKAEADVADAFRAVRTRLLSVPSRARQRRPTLSDGDIELFEELIEVALEELASRGDADE
jgi:phage terminase Nu1 subunit (DNA packaging protein)